MRDPDAPADEASPLDVIRGLADLARLQADAIAVTDLRRRVVVWNEAAERLYGIGAGDALGRPIADLFDSVVISEGTSTAKARADAIEHGSWRGRIADRPRIGSLVGHELVIDVVLNRLDGPDGRPVGAMSVNRDITASVQLERELLALGTLTTATGTARSRATFAERALEVVTATTGADHGVIVVAHGRAGHVIAGVGMTPTLESIVRVPWADAPAIRAVAPAGRVIKGAVDRLPLAPATRQMFLGAGIRTMLVVGLHREQELIGVIALGWDGDKAATPSDTVAVLIASTIARGLENARLIEEIVRRAEAERTTTARLRALDELTHIGEHAATIDVLARRSADLINTSLGASGTAYGLLAADGHSYAVSALTDVRPRIAAWLRDNPPDERSTFRRWRAGEGPFLEAFVPGTVPLPIVELARAAGVTAYAAIPIRIEGQVVGGIAAYFDRPTDEIHVDAGALERVASIVSISLENWRLRERLKGSERRYRTLFEESPDALIIERLDGTVLEVNDAATRTYRAEREWLLGRPSTELAVFDVPISTSRSAALEPGDSFVVRSTGLRRGGDRFPQEVQVLRVELDGEARLLVRVRDLTDQERLQAELIQAQKMEATGQLVSGVAHELNNPLAAILGFSQLIRQDTSLPDDLRHNADLLVEEASRTRRIVGDLLDFARQRPPERHPTSIRALVESVLTLQSYSLGHGLAEVEVDIPADLPAVELDRGQLQQVLVNLTHNAIDAIHAGGGSRIRISARREGSADDERVRVTVADDGVGVAPEHVPRLFEAFFTTKPPGEGSGLGLPVSYGLVRSHGGELRYAPSPFGRRRGLHVRPSRPCRPHRRRRDRDAGRAAAGGAESSAGGLSRRRSRGRLLALRTHGRRRASRSRVPPRPPKPAGLDRGSSCSMTSHRSGSSSTRPSAPSGTSRSSSSSAMRRSRRPSPATSPRSCATTRWRASRASRCTSRSPSQARLREAIRDDERRRAQPDPRDLRLGPRGDAARQTVRPRHAGRDHPRRAGCEGSAARVGVEAAPGLLAEMAGLHEIDEDLWRPQVLEAQAVLDHAHDPETDVEADEVGELERAHRMVEPDPRAGIDVLGRAEALLDRLAWPRPGTA